MIVLALGLSSDAVLTLFTPFLEINHILFTSCGEKVSENASTWYSSEESSKEDLSQNGPTMFSCEIHNIKVLSIKNQSTDEKAIL